MSRSWVTVDCKAISDNVAALLSAGQGTPLCAVVKADGYGHGAVQVARAALIGGASCLAVAQVGEAQVLRDAGIDSPILILSEPDPAEFDLVVALGLQTTLYTKRGVVAAAEAQSRVSGGSEGSDAVLRVHLKVDTGMHRVGASVGDFVNLAQEIDQSDYLELAAAWTHLASSEDQSSDTANQQLDRFDSVVGDIQASGVRVDMTHVGNTGAAFIQPRTHNGMIRCGIGIYGLSPGSGLGGELKPALTWASTVSLTKRLPAGSTVSYGGRGVLVSDSTVATVPVGYADGFRRDLWRRGGCVLIGGKRRPIVGVVTMDQFVVDCGDDEVTEGDEVVILGAQGEEQVSVAEMAGWLETIDYEVVCAIGTRVSRRYV